MPGGTHKDRVEQATEAAGDPFYGGGEAGAILRSIDWSNKSIGPVEHWPQSLRTALSICLASRHPICILWGPERLYFYNDAYTPIVGAKHPWALGESYVRVWPEIWESSIRPILEGVERTGEASWCDNLLLVLRRHGYDEECYFAFSFAPMRIENGSLGGVFTAITETTTQVIDERRLRTLRDLSALAARAKSAAEACRIAGGVLASNRLDVPFAAFYLLDATGTTAQLVEQTGIAGARALPASVSIVDDGSADPWNFREAAKSGDLSVRGQLGELLGDLPGAPWPEPTNTAAIVPITRAADALPYGFVVCGASPRRPFDADYQTFFRLVGSHITTAVSNADAYEQERRRSESLAELTRAKTDFFSNVSHEFRTPLTLMLGPLDSLLQEGTRDRLEPDVREQLEITRRNSLRLLKLVNTLLDFSRIESGKMEPRFEPVDLASFTAELAAVFRSAVEAAGMRLVIDCGQAAESAWVDRDMWEKIVFNLLSNACKFTLRGEIRVSLRFEEDEFVLQVRDTGLGIPPEHHRRIFERFHRVANAGGRSHEGSGIGLSLVQELVQFHNGRIAVQSEVNVGTTFTVRVPSGRAHVVKPHLDSGGSTNPIQADVFIQESLPPEPHGHASVPAHRPASKEAIPPRILVVDDNADMRDYVSRLLSDTYEIDTAPDGRAAMEVAEASPPDLVLADVMMPHLDGFGLIKALRSVPRTRTVPVILLSARAGEESYVEGLEAGADDYLFKPFSAVELKARVRSHLHLAAERRSAQAQVTASEARLQQLVTILPGGIISWDAAGQITFYNRRAAEICGGGSAAMENLATFSEAFQLLDDEGRPIPQERRPVSLALKEGRSFQNIEVTAQRRDGSRFVMSCNINPTVDANGTIVGAISVLQDVTADKQAREALRVTEERYRAVFQQASVGIMEVDLQGSIIRSNPALSRLVGLPPERLLGMNWRDLVPADDLHSNVALVESLLEQQLPSATVERRYLRADGSVGWLDLFATVIRDAAGEPVYGLGMVVDISERKQAEAELRETEGRFRLAADNAPVLIWIADLDRQCTWFNRPWLQFVGRTLQQEIGAGWTDNLHPEDYPQCLATYMAAYDERRGFSMEFRLRRHDGVYRWMLVRGQPRLAGSEFAGLIGSCVDITDRRDAEQAMHESRNAERARRQELEVLTQVAPAGIWMANDPECTNVTGNAAAHAMMRTRAGSNLSRPVLEAKDSRQVRFFQNGVHLALDQMPMRVAARTGRAVVNQEVEFRFADGSSTWAYGSATPLLDEKGAVRGVICTMVDITERKRAEAALRKSEEQLRLVTDHASVLLSQVDRAHRYRFVNRTYAERYGRTPSEMVGLHVSTVLGAEAYGIAREHMERALAGARDEFELEISLPGQPSRWGHVVYVPERSGDGIVGGFVGVIVDITQRKRAELELERARDEAVAASRAKDDFLAALSHELRTPLSPVLLLASEAAADPALPLPVRADFETIRKSVELEARLIDDLLDLTRIVRNKLVLEDREVDIIAVLRDALATVRGEFEAKRIGIAANLASGPQLVRGDAVRLQQVFWNILKNAAKFTPDGGRVTVLTLIAEDGKSIAIEISDTGIGITQQELSRVFEAFSQGDHATPSGSHRFGGLGLGLAISRRVIQLHHGRIVAESGGRHRGSLFRVELPLYQPAQSAPSVPTLGGKGNPAPAANASPPAGAKILLVEDHASTRIALEQLLVRRNFTVKSAASVAEARMLASQFKFDYLVSDIGLPDGNGYDLMKELSDRHRLRGIALTGYGMEEDVNRSQNAGFVQHLTKPVRIQSLDQALAALARGNA